MTQNGANKPSAKQKGSNATPSGQAGQSVPDTSMGLEQQASTSSSTENIRLRMGLDKTQTNQPFQALAHAATWQQRVIAIQTLALQGQQSATSKSYISAASKYLEECIQNKNEDMRVREAAIRALDELRQAGYVFRDALLDLYWQLDMATESTLYAKVIETLASAGTREWDEGQKFRTDLIQRLSRRTTPPVVRAALVRLLATLGKEAPVNVFAKLLNETNLDWCIRNAIVLSLDASFTDVFETLLYDPKLSIRVSAFYRLDKERALKRILQDLRMSRDYVIKDRAAQVLGEVGKGTPEEVDILASIASNKQNRTLLRMSAILAIGHLRERHTHVVEPELFLQRLREDSNKSVRAAAEAVTDIFTSPFDAIENENE